MIKLEEGSQPFNLEVSYRLLETGDEGPKPLIVYLHGYKQNGAYFEKKAHSLRTLNAWHLFLNGPYPVYDEKHKRNVEQWGRAWYLYDGRQPQFMKSLEKSSVFIDSIIDKVQANIGSNQLTVLGYSMGGYLAGYYALSRPQRIDDLVVIGGRIKTEHFKNESYQNLHVLEIHGNKDESVAVQSVEKSCKQLEKLGAETTFTILDEEHGLNNRYLEVAKKWLKNHEFNDKETI